MTKPTLEERLAKEFGENWLRYNDNVISVFSSLLQETEDRVRREMRGQIEKEFIDKYRCELLSNDTFSERLQKETTNSTLDELGFFIS